MDPAAVSLGKRGGAKGGYARAASLTPERRTEIAKDAAAKRWGGQLPAKMCGKSTGALLTTATVAYWHARRREIALIRRALAAEDADLRRKLAAVAIIIAKPEETT